MNWVHTILMLALTFLAVYLQTTFNALRGLLGAQVDLLPGLVVYAGLSSGPIPMTLVAVCGGLWLDSLSANPLGISILPLFLVGFILQWYRGLILRDQFYAQWVLGVAASAAVPVLSVLLILNTGKQPLIGLFSIWQWLVMAAIGGVVTPFWFIFCDRLMLALTYRELDTTSFRPDRQIKRGRN